MVDWPRGRPADVQVMPDGEPDQSTVHVFRPALGKRGQVIDGCEPALVHMSHERRVIIRELESFFGGWHRWHSV